MNIPYWWPHPHNPSPVPANCSVCGERLPLSVPTWCKFYWFGVMRGEQQRAFNAINLRAIQPLR